MKKLIAVALCLVMVMAMFAGCGKDKDAEMEVPGSSLEILENVWALYGEDEKFPVMGGDMVNIVDGAPGAYGFLLHGRTSQPVPETRTRFGRTVPVGGELLHGRSGLCAFLARQRIVLCLHCVCACLVWMAARIPLVHRSHMLASPWNHHQRFFHQVCCSTATLPLESHCRPHHTGAWRA